MILVSTGNKKTPKQPRRLMFPFPLEMVLKMGTWPPSCAHLTSWRCGEPQLYPAGPGDVWLNLSALPRVLEAHCFQSCYEFSWKCSAVVSHLCHHLFLGLLFPISFCKGLHTCFSPSQFCRSQPFEGFLFDKAQIPIVLGGSLSRDGLVGRR